MHIPDGFLSTPVWAGTWAFSALAVGYCTRRTSSELEEKMIPRMGLMAAYIFTAQLITFPVPGGTSGHILGGALAALLLGPCAGVVVMAVVLAAQALLFHDGGVTTLGANMLNMAILGVAGGHLAFTVMVRIAGGHRGRVAGIAAASWLSVMLSSVACALELALSGTSPLRVVLPVMALSNGIVGILEAVVTCLIVGFIARVRPDILYCRHREEALPCTAEEMAR